MELYTLKHFTGRLIEIHEHFYNTMEDEHSQLDSNSEDEHSLMDYEMKPVLTHTEHIVTTPPTPCLGLS